LSPTFRLVIAAVLALVLLGSGAVLVWVLVTRSGDDDVQAGREEVMAQTEQFMLRSFSYGPDLLNDDGTMPEYRDRVTAVISPKFAAEFDKSAGTAEQLVSQSGMSRRAEVFATAVSTMDADSASALVAGSFTDSFVQGKKSIDREPSPFRIEVSLVKIDGEWLVDDFSGVGVDPEQGEQP
jgi:hypothetical protein